VSDISRERISSIKSFPSLVKFLRDDLGWPLTTEEIEELTFEYEPEELGIDPQTAVKIREIKQLRPFTTDQPWGIFYISFEPKKLPVVVLRRVLRALVIKKRQSATKPSQAAWNLHDLLFISSYGETDGRAITFAHFSEDEESKLPTLRVVGWDTQDTPLHMDRCISELQRLTFDEELSPDKWREQWSEAFTLEHREVITTSKALAKKLAALASRIRKRVNKILAVESEKGPLRQLYKAFQETLVHDLSEDDFADMYAQTITYGLFSTKKSRQAGLLAENLLDMIPRTNPFLKELLSTFLTVGGRKGKIDFDELGIDDVVQTLRNTDMDAVLRDFEDRNPAEDPVIHFYEGFLKEYDAKKKVKRGVFYTPRPVVSFIVRSVDAILRKDFGLEYGLADTTTWGEMAGRNKDIKIPKGVSEQDPFVQILDPAAGTGTFLVEVINLIYDTMTKKWEEEGHMPLEFAKLWNEYVPTGLLRRLYGFELMMAPYAIAHMKIGLKLFETGYKFGSDERARIYLTNSLQKPKSFSEELKFEAPALADEAKAANFVKRHVPVSVLIGNPPYSKASQHLGPEYEYLIQPFRFYNQERIQERGAILFERDINNDYLKFIGFYCNLFCKNTVGILSVITSNSYLDGKNFRGARDALLNIFDSIKITDLHGDRRSSALAHQGVVDENVFDIETGVSIATCTTKHKDAHSAKVFYGEVIGTYENKIIVLADKNPRILFQEVKIDRQRYCSFLPTASTAGDEYISFPRLDDMFNISVDGIKTSRDGLVISEGRAKCSQKIQTFMNSHEPTSIKSSFKISLTRWDYQEAQEYLRKYFDENLIQPIAYRPFDFRHIYYDSNLVFSDRMAKMKHMILGENLALVCASRLSAYGFDNILPTNCLAEMKYASHDTNSRVFPAFIFSGELRGRRKETNIPRDIMKQMPLDHHLSDEEKTMQIIGYIYAILQAPNYRARFHSEIKNDFPRVPVTANPKLFEELYGLGLRLISAHLLRTELPDGMFPFVGDLDAPIETPRFEESKVFVTKRGYFDNVKQEIFSFRIGGYQVCKTWFSAGNKSGLQRKGRPLTDNEINTFRRILASILKTISIRKTIDEVIDAHGGWPGAFVASSKK
jgi:predicted helicase